MDPNAGKGGSYIRQKDGSLKLVERTEPAKSTAAPVPAVAETAKAPAGKKENGNG